MIKPALQSAIIINVKTFLNQKKKNKTGVNHDTRKHSQETL